jgi:HlyD family secretion protein
VQATVTEARALRALQRRARVERQQAALQQDLDAAAATLRAQSPMKLARQLRVAQAQAAEVNQTDLGKAVIRSPINGVVLTRSVEPGQTVAASLSAPVLFTLAEDLAQMELHVYVDEADVGRVKDGQAASPWTLS